MKTPLAPSARSLPARTGRRATLLAALAAALLPAAALLGSLACQPRQSQASPTDGASAGGAAGKASAMRPVYSKSGYDVTPLPRATVEKLASRLDPEAYRITQKAGTEPPFCGTLLDNKKDGVYVCAVCGLPLFSSRHKFHSGTGWPSFYEPVDPAHVARKPDHSYGMDRVEIDCARCGAHLGHVFDDGPPPTGERFCLNSASLKFYEKGTPLPPESQPVKAEIAYFAGGCFWGVQHQLSRGPGVLSAVSGYMQGHLDHPTYEDVCSHGTGHAETVKVVFDPARISYRRLLEAFFVMHDPTQLDRQGPDVGDQYRSGIWTTSPEQEREAKAYVAELTAAKRFGDRKIVTVVEPAKTFWPAEEYHQDYIAKNGASCHVKDPW